MNSRKLLILTFCLPLIVMILTACNGTDEKEENVTKADHKQDTEKESNVKEENETDEANEEQKENLHLQILDIDKEYNTDDQQAYTYIEGYINEEDNDAIGDNDEFTILPAAPVFIENEEVAFLFIGINRLPYEIKNLSFEFSYLTPDGDYLLKNETFSLSEEEASAIEVNSVIPFVFKTTEKQNEILEDASFEYDHLFSEFPLEIHDISYDKVD